MARAARSDQPVLFDLQAEVEAEQVTARLYAAVALNRPVRREFTYTVPDPLIERVAVGSRVSVPFGRTRQVGVVVSLAEKSELVRLRAIDDVLDPQPIVDESLLELTRWIAERYASAWGEALAAVLPAPLKRERGQRGVLVIEATEQADDEALAELEERFPKQHRLLRTLREFEGQVELRDVLRRTNLSESPARSLERRGWVRIVRVDALPDGLEQGRGERLPPERLSPAQEHAVQALSSDLEQRRQRVWLLHGVTGSGKTEVYLQVIERALALGRTAIVLVPEIALTPQTVGWFRSRFGSVAVVHSGMTDSKRLDTWRRIQSGEARMVVGARSAIFAPVKDLGVVVVDEEHEPSFKQGNVPRYHARDVAIERARRAGAICILGSATPALETWHAAKAGTIGHLSLPGRVGGGSPPSVHVVDMREEKRTKGSSFSPLLRTFLAEVVQAGEQSILFLNRRGFVPVLWCPGCEETLRCSQCDVSMTYHRRIKRLVCHSCCEEARVPETCPGCSRPGLRFLGAGSERVEAELKTLLPGARVRRMDSDTMRRRDDYEELLTSFGRGEIDVLVGTQMLAKGLDFPKVTLVGIVSADLALHLPDFRAAERTYQLIAQVAGRAGRGQLPGRIVIQTSAPEHPAIRKAAAGDFEGFARAEDVLREELGYPPYGRLLRVISEHEAEARADEGARLAADAIRAGTDPAKIRVLGPAPAPTAFLRGRHRRHLIVKTVGQSDLESAIDAAANFASEHGRSRIVVDVDPMSML